MKRKIMMLAAVLALGLSACGGKDASTEDANDTPKCGERDVKTDKVATTHCTNVQAKDSLAFNNNFPNVAYSCTRSGTMVYVTTDRRMLVLPDPNCPGYVQGQEPSVVIQQGG